MQAQSREKVLQKMQDAGLVEKVEFDRKLNMTFPNPSKIPPPVLMLANISFGYARGPELYSNVDFGVDLDSRIALVGPNGAGKTTRLLMPSLSSAMICVWFSPLMPKRPSRERRPPSPTTGTSGMSCWKYSSGVRPRSSASTKCCV